MTDKIRCCWCGSDELYQQYHDNEWGIPEKNDQRLFEMLILEGAQAGLSWITVLKKRDHYRKVFHQFDINRVAEMEDSELESLLEDPGIIRNRLKVYSARKNARAFIRVQQEWGSFSQYLWEFVNHSPIINNFKSTDDLPASTALSDKIAKDLKKKGFSFVGTRIIYAYMQATGMVNDHQVDCFRYEPRSDQSTY